MSLQTTPVTTLGNKLLNFSAADVKVKEGKASNPRFAQVLEIYACYTRTLFRCSLHFFHLTMIVLHLIKI